MVLDTFGFSPFCQWKPAPISAYAARLADFVLSSTKHLFAIFKLLCLFTPICLYSSTVPSSFPFKMQSCWLGVSFLSLRS